MDILIDKPVQLRGYALHRLVAQYLDGQPGLWVDEGVQVRIRRRNVEPTRYPMHKLLGFTLRACVSTSTKGRHRYLPLPDWRGRRQWLTTKAAANGFRVLGVHVSAGMQHIETHDGRRFTVDATQFVGLLSVTDPDAFARCLVHGLGKVGKAFGLGLLVVD